MPLELVTGPINAAKAGVVLGRFRQLAEAGEAPVLVVPTSADRDAYEAELLDSGALIGGKVLTWERFVRDLARRAGIEGRVIGPIRRRLIVREVLKAAIDSQRLFALADSATAPGFPRALERLILDCSRELLDPQDLVNIAVGGSPERAAEAATLVQSYFAALADGGVIDRDLQARRSVAALAADPLLWGASPVLFYGFSDLTGIQAEAVRTLAASNRVMVALAVESDRDVGVADVAIARLTAPGGPDVEQQQLEGSGGEAAIARMATSLFAKAPTGSVTDDGSIEILAGSGTRAALELAASRVAEFAAGGGELGRIAIVRPHGDWDATMEALLRDYGLDCARPESAQLSATTLGRALLALCRIAYTPAETVAADGLLWIRAATGIGEGASLEAADEVDSLFRRRGSGTGGEALKEWEGRTGGSLESLAALRAANNPKAVADALAGAADELLQANAGDKGGRLRRDALFDAQVVSSVAKASLDLGALLDRDDPQPMLEELAALEIDIDTGAPRPGAVQLTDPSSIRARGFDAIIVLGLEHGLFPARGAGDPFFGDVPADFASGRIADGGRPKFTAAAARQEAGERERFVACFARAAERVVLVRRARDDSGGAIAASVFVEEVERLLGRRGSDDEAEPDRLAGALAEAGAVSTPRTQLRAAAAAAGLTPIPAPPVQLGDSARERIAAEREHVVSPSRLESYCECRMSWLGQNMLKPRELEPESEPTFRGTAVHLALQRAVDVAIKQNDGLVDAKILADARAAIHEAIKESADEGPKTIAAAIALKRAELLALEWLDTEIARGWKAKAIETEFEFGRDGKPAFELAEGLPLSGSIDRVDVIGEGDGRRILIRDYKSGRTIWGHQKWEESRRLQPALYMLAALKLLGGTPAAALYESVTKRSMAGAIAEGTPGEEQFSSRSKTVVTQDELQLLIDEGVKRALAAVAGIDDGALGSDSAHCSGGYGCKYPWLCGALR